MIEFNYETDFFNLGQQYTVIREMLATSENKGAAVMGDGDTSAQDDEIHDKITLSYPDLLPTDINDLFRWQ
jgi:hypothetical protein